MGNESNNERERSKICIAGEERKIMFKRNMEKE